MGLSASCGDWRTDVSRGVQERASFRYIRYGSVWEDAELLCEALAPVARGGRLLSIASAGDNALALLTLEPAEVVAVDLSAAQLACVELRVCAFSQLDHPALLRFLGVTHCERRELTYQELSAQLGTAARAFWDEHPNEIRSGVIHSGKFERYLRLFRTRLLPLVHPRRVVDRWFSLDSREERERFYDERWNSWRWRTLFRLFVSRPVMGRVGRDPDFLAHAQGPVADRILARTRRALTSLPGRNNPYLRYALQGNYAPDALPLYLRPEHFETIRRHLSRLRWVEGPIHEAAEGPFDSFNLSDVFEYMSPAEHEQCYASLLERANPGARLAYWNLLVDRSCPASLRARVRPLSSRAAELGARDQAPFYSAFHLDEVAR